MANALNEELEGRYVVILEEAMAPEYSDIKYRVFRADGGFGCHSYTIGSAVAGVSPYDQERFRIDGYEVERFATDEEIALATGGSDG